MELRDKLNTMEGFMEIIEESYEFIKDDLEDLKSYDQNDSDTLQKVHETYQSLFKYNFEILETIYSKGSGLIEVKNQYFNCFEYFLNCWQSEWGYVQMVNALAIGIMFDIEDGAFDKLVALVDRDNVEDRLIDLLIASRKPDRPIAQKFLWNKPYKAVSAVVDGAQESNDSALEQLKKYLKAWYGALEVKTHESKWNIHTGYWSWEAGALAKILGLDDSALKDEPYYPYDMVHHKDQ